MKKPEISFATKNFKRKGYMPKLYSVPIEKWQTILKDLSSDYQVFAPIYAEEFLEYEKITPENAAKISYNVCKPTSPLKAFMFPIKENVIRDKDSKKQRLIFGVPACDLSALDLLDKIFLDEDFLDIYYQQNRENTVLIGTDCYNFQDNCHCTTYGIEPVAQKNCDIAQSFAHDEMIFSPLTPKGETFLEKFKSELAEIQNLPDEVQEKRDEIKKGINEKNKDLPDAEKTRRGILKPEEDIWKKHAKTCVSCGACAVICPTCHCFLLIDKENFEKIKNWDSCQYPAFERVAAGEDPLKKIYNRLKNRYLCKFVHKSDMFGEIACTGCGRCITACIGKIDKNEVIIEVCK